uniref:RNase H domain-containing protein n=1 Tax=Caenorhabditis japonica TaxID=281687 RepID=A0A8R1ENE7_CAEJA
MDGEEYSPELMDTFAEKILEKLKPAIKMFAKRREEEKPPTLSQKGLQMQADLNTKLINMLESAMETGDLPGTIKKASELLKERNKELKLLDTDPEALKLVSKMRAVAEAAGTSSDTLDSKLLAIAQIVKEEKPREKRLPPTRSNRWFPGAGSIYRPSGVRSNNFYGYERVGDRDFGSDTRRFKRQAESREDEPERLHAKMPVRSEEVNKLQQSGVVVECRTPRVVSPLQVAVNEHSISRQREMAITVVEHQSMGETQRQQIPLSPDLRNIGPAQFKWIPRAENTEADEASRDFDYDDWSVHDWVFRFAEPGSAGADVFEWVAEAKELGLAWWVPPPKAVPKLMEVAKREKLKGVLGVPMWYAHPSYQALVDRHGQFISNMVDWKVFKVNTKMIVP